jgi:hypothetical protein
MGDTGEEDAQQSFDSIEQCLTFGNSHGCVDKLPCLDLVRSCRMSVVRVC